MQKFGLRIVVVLAALLFGAARAEAQVFTPTFYGPADGGRFGVFLVDWADLGVEGSLRTASSGWTIGLRGGVLDSGEDISATVGADAQLPLAFPTAPLRTAFTLGGQAIFGDAEAFGGQVGLNIGAAFPAGGLVISPYIHPRVALVNGFGPDDETDLDLLADLGFNFGLGSGLTIHVAAELGGVGADWGVGFSMR